MTKFYNAVAVAAMALGFGIAGTAKAATPVYVDLLSSPVFAGPTASKTVLLLQYDSSATRPLTVHSVNIVGLESAQQVTVDNCGTSLGGGTYTIMPGSHCFIEAPTSGIVAGETIVTDGTAGNANVLKYARGMLETRDGNNNVLTHAELH